MLASIPTMISPNSVMGGPDFSREVESLGGDPKSSRVAYSGRG